MIYLFNTRDVKAEAQNFDFGTIYQIALGEKGRGRKLMAITCPEGLVLKRGMNTGVSVSFTKSGKPRIIAKEDGYLYMIISAQGGYTRRGNGTIELPITNAKIEKTYKDGDGVERTYDKFNNNDNITVMAAGHGADGDAGRIGYWDVVLLKVDGSNTIRVRTSGGGYGTPADYLIVKDTGVTHIEGNETMSAIFDDGVEIPNVDAKWFGKDCKLGDGFINIFNRISGASGI